jgi:cell division septum initiation protein DivIVA
MAPTNSTSIQDADPDDLGRREFTKQRKGWDPVEVRAHLLNLAAEIKRLRTLEDEHARAIARLEDELAKQREFDESRLTHMLGEETGRVLEAARTAAIEIREKAEDNAARLVREAQERSEELLAESTTIRDAARQEADELTATARANADDTVETARAEADRLRSEAEEEVAELRATAASVLEERTKEAEEAAELIRSEAAELLRTTAETAEEQRTAAEADAERIRAEARAEAERTVEDATERGRSIVAEARDARERMLADLADRRAASRRQLEALRAGRERLLEAFATARESFDGVTDELVDALPAAREAAERAAAEMEPIEDDLDLLASDLGLEDLSGLELPATTTTDAEGEDTPGADTTAASTAADDASDAPQAGDDAVPAPDATGQEQASGDEQAPGDEQASGDEEGAREAAVAEAVPLATTAPLAVEVPSEQNGVAAGGHLRLVPGGPTGADLDDDLHDDDDDDEHVEGADTDPASGAAEAIFARLRAGESEDDDGGEAGIEADGGGAVVVSLTGEVAVITAQDDSTPLDDAAWLDARDEVLVPLERSVTRRVKRTLTDHENTVRDAVRRHRKGSVPPGLLGSVAELREAVVSAVREDVVQIVTAGAAFHGDPGHGVAVDAGPVAEMVAGELVGPIVDPLHARLTAAVDAHGASDGVDELDAALRSAFREWRNDHVPELAGDLVTAAFNEGIQRSAQPGTAHWWIIDDGGLANPDAEDNRLAEGIVAGQEFPTGDLRPPAHAGCRCLLVPGPR